MLIERDDPLFRDLSGEGYKELYVARDSAGNLVARQVTATYLEFPVWCGDGCKGIPLPWTFRTRSSWSAVDRWDPTSPRKAAPACW